MLRRFSEEWTLPVGSLGEQLRAAARAGDMATVDRVAGELAGELTAGTVPADQEVASLAALVVHQRGDGAGGSGRGGLSSPRRPKWKSAIFAPVHWIAPTAAPEALAELAALRTDCAADEDRFGEACCLFRLG